MNIIILPIIKLKKIEFSNALSDLNPVCYEGYMNFFLNSIGPIKHYILEILISEKQGQIGLQVINFYFLYQDIFYKFLQNFLLKERNIYQKIKF